MRTCFILFCLLFYWPVIGQQNLEILIPYLAGQKYGYMDEGGKMHLSPKYDFALPFLSEYEITLVLLDNKPILINRKGKKVFQLPVRVVKQDFYNKSNSFIPESPEAIDLNIKKGTEECAFYSVLGQINNYKIFDKVGDYYVVNDLKKVFLIDKKGAIQSEKFDRIRHFPYGEFEYCITEDSIKAKKGLLDKNGKELLQCSYDDIYYQGKGIFKVTDNNTSHQFKVILENKYEEAEFEPEVREWQIKRRSGKSGVVDSVGNIVLPFEFDRLYPLIDRKYLYVRGFETGIINSKSEILYTQKLDSSIEQSSDIPPMPYWPFTDSLVFFNINKMWNLVSIDGKVYQPGFSCIYVDNQKLVPGFAGVSINGKAGVVDKNVFLVLPAIYSEIICLGENKSFLARDDKNWTWLNASGKIIYKDFEEFSYIIPHHLFVLNHGNWYFVDEEGREFYKE